MASCRSSSRTRHGSLITLPTFLTDYAGMLDLWVVNPPGAAGNDGGTSNHVTLVVIARHNAPAGSTSSATGTTSVLAAFDAPVVIGASVTNGGQPVAATVTGSAQNAVGTNGGELIGNDGASLIGNDGASLIEQRRREPDRQRRREPHRQRWWHHRRWRRLGNVGRRAATKYPLPPRPPRPTSQSSTRSTSSRTAANPTTSDYTASTDANGVFLIAHRSLSNGIPGTHTHTIALDGIAQPITYTITNLDPNDGHPAVDLLPVAHQRDRRATARSR